MVKFVIVFLPTETPLTLATELANPKPMMLALLEGGSHLDFRNARGRTSVHRAAELGNTAALQVSERTDRQVIDMSTMNLIDLINLLN